MGSRRVVRSVPGWRGGVVRVSAMAPSVAARGLGLFVAQGRRAISRNADPPPGLFDSFEQMFGQVLALFEHLL